MKRGITVGKVIKIVLCVVLFGTLFTFIVMSLWNAILPAVLGVKAITFWQALGIIILSKILFGGIGGGGGKWKHRGREQWRDKMMNKWGSMTEEDKEKFKNSWEARCGGSWRRPFGGERFGEKKTEDKGEAGAE